MPFLLVRTRRTDLILGPFRSYFIRPYRAPELLFGTTDYDACAIDLWSTGAVLAEFFTPLRLRKSYEYDDDDWPPDEDEEPDDASEDEEVPAKQPFIVPKSLSPDQRDVEWARDSLYDSSRGQIGLAWSIFRVHGTPTEESWPVRLLSSDSDDYVN